MESLFFGPEGGNLYGVYCAANSRCERPEGIVICYPFGQEYMRAHRPVRLLASNLADMGYHVLRFDYSASGDSAGDLTTITARDWVADVVLAVNELRNIAALDSIAIIGLRLGSLLAAAAAVQSRDISRLVLWDAVTNGANYVQELIQGLPQLPLEAGASNFLDSDGNLHINGFSMPVTLQHSLRSLNLADIDISPVASVLQIASHESDESTQLQHSWSRRHNYSYQLCPAPHDWNYVDNEGSIMLPQPVMAAIKKWFK